MCSYACGPTDRGIRARQSARRRGQEQPRDSRCDRNPVRNRSCLAPAHSSPDRSHTYAPAGRPLLEWRPPGPDEYAYLLGIYPGDGCVVDPPRGGTWLTVTLDDQYPEIIRRVESAIG
jgi:hypothetical protein